MSIDVILGEANDGHAELEQGSLLESGVVDTLYRGRDGVETLALVRRLQGSVREAAPPGLLILLSADLPGISGLDVLAALKKHPHQSRIPVMMLTSASDPAVERQCRELKCDAYVTKWTMFLGLAGVEKTIRYLCARALGHASRDSSAELSPGSDVDFVDSSSGWGNHLGAAIREDMSGGG